MNLTPRLRWTLVFPIAAVMGAIPMEANLASDLFTLTETSAIEVEGSTKGSFWLPNVVMAGRDAENNLCVGYAESQTPDHVMELDDSFSRIKIQVESGGDSTLVIQGPSDGKVRCGDTSIDLRGREDADAAMEDTAWKKGKYKIWVGTFESNQKLNYRLKIDASR